MPEPSRAATPAARCSPWWVLAGAVVLPLVYLPSLGTRFDFIDDGNLVYPAPAMSLGPRLERAWDRVVANYEHLGPFRPVVWAHWEIEADLFRGSDAAWRVGRLVWCALAAAALLWLMHELRLPPAGALPAAALAFWNPYRNEIWTSLTLAEGVAMPYALAALAAAVRAGRSQRPWGWDCAAVLGVLLALGCKNTFAALVPVAIYLRCCPDGRWVRPVGKGTALLALTLVLPVAHLAYFEAHWHSGQYRPGGPTWAQYARILSGWRGALSLECMGPALLFSAGALALFARGAGWYAFRELLARHRVALTAGALLAVAGGVAYLPMGAFSGRYTMPAVWGLDLMLAALFGMVAATPAALPRRAVYAALVAGLQMVAVTSLARQDRFAARADVLWQALEFVEQTATPEARVGWICGDAGQLNVEEGIHFAWHLQARGRSDVRVNLCDDGGRLCPRVELPPPDREPTVLLSGPTAVPPPGWHEQQRFVATYWMGQRRTECVLWGRD